MNSITPLVKVNLRPSDCADGSMFGRGVAELCRRVDSSGSLNKAAKTMGMAYSKAWRIVKRTEESLGVQLLERDGAHGSTLTPAGKHLLRAYSALEDELSVYAAQRFQELLQEIQD